MTDSEIADAVDRMQKLKFYPRDDLGNKRLLLFCERMVGEVSPMQREQLEQAIDVFEIAMSSGDREQFQRVKDGLLVLLSSMGIEYDDAETNDERDR